MEEARGPSPLVPIDPRGGGKSEVAPLAVEFADFIAVLSCVNDFRQRKEESCLAIQLDLVIGTLDSILPKMTLRGQFEKSKQGNRKKTTVGKGGGT